MKKLLLVLVLIVSAGSAMAQSKVAHVNSQTLLDTIPSRKEAIRKLQEFEQAGITELKEMEADLQKAYARYQAERPSWSPTIVKIEEEKIMKKEQALQEREQSLNLEMQAYSNELNEPILKRVQEAVQIVADRKKLNYVIDESVTLYFAGGTDITAEVIVELMRLEGQ
jgi:outer membrane protein